MRRRLLGSLSVAAGMTALIVFLQLSDVSVAGQAPARATGQAQKTAWGHPNLEGIWAEEVDTPFERPTRYGNREFLTDKEVADLEEKRAKVTIGGDGVNFQSVYGGPRKGVSRRTSLIVDPPSGRIPPFTPEAQRRNRLNQEYRMAQMQHTETCKLQYRECKGWPYGPPHKALDEPPPFYNVERMNRQDGPEDLSPMERCIDGVPPDYRGYRRIVQGPDSLAIAIDVGEGMGFQRVVYLTGSHPPRHVTLRHGDSRGRFEGNTLVVETTNFSVRYPFFSMTQAGNMSSSFRGEQLKLVERFTRLDANTLEHAVTVSDPTVWTAPWTYKQELKKQSDIENHVYYEPRCHEGNFGTVGLLVGARMDEKAFAEGRGPNPATFDKYTDYRLGTQPEKSIWQREQ